MNKNCQGCIHYKNGCCDIYNLPIQGDGGCEFYDFRGKMNDCLKCICLVCMKQFKTNPRTCGFSDCEWCEGEPGRYSTVCKEYVRKGRQSWKL